MKKSDYTIDKIRKDIERSLQSFLLYVKNKYRLGLSSDILLTGIEDFLKRKGKRIRPILFLLSYQGYTKRRKFSYQKLLKCSLAFELFHDFVLVHDDVINNSPLRRGKPTLHKLFSSQFVTSTQSNIGFDLSIVAGDIIFSFAIDIFLSVEEDLLRKQLALRKLAETGVFTGTGEFIDIVNSHRKVEKVTEKEVCLKYILKTAKYTFECPLLVGAILAGVNESELRKLSKLGITLGKAFQIQDDLLGVFSTSKDIGKSVISDLDESKKTLLVWKAYENLDKKDRANLRKILDKPKKKYGDLTKFRALIRKSGAHKYCLDQTLSLLNDTASICAKLKMKKKYKVLFTNFLKEIFSKTESLADSSS